MAKYDPLEIYLSGVRSETVRLTFAEMDGILGSPLPRSAYQYSAFWGNSTEGSTHVWADAWQRAGWRVTGFNLDQRYVDFRRFRAPPTDSRESTARLADSDRDVVPEDDVGGPSELNDQCVGEEVQLVAIKTRRGQAPFRERLLRAYDSTCAVSGSKVEPLLEAAHIVPHAVMTNYAVTNGILLRSDVHTLFDLHLIAIDIELQVKVSKSLKWTEYWQYNGRRMFALPASMQEYPSPTSLSLHHDLFLAREEALEDR